MALTSLMCSLTLFVMVILGIIFPNLVFGVSADENFRRVDPSMLRTTVGSSSPSQQAIVPIDPAVTSTAQTPVREAFVISQKTAPLTKDEEEKISQEKRELLEEERQWKEHKAAVAKRPRRTKHKRRPPTATLDPKKTWQAFLRHTELQAPNDKKKGQSPPKKVHPSILRTPFNSYREVDEIRVARVNENNSGANAGISRQEMIEHMRDLIRDATERGISRVDSKCTTNSTKPDCVEKRNPAGHPLLEIERAALIPETYSAFTWRLSHKVKVRKQREVELKPYYRPRLTGSIERGDGLHEDAGKFIAPINGLYVFNANVLFNVSLSPLQQQQQTSPSRNSSDGVVILKLCIDENCITSLSLQAMRAIVPNESVFTLNLSGPLRLLAGQSVSLYVTNKGKTSIVRVLEDSTFSGYLTSYF
ncbi:erythroferrone-like [Galendromus occidentalis]|uniref:Erythroferrone-like n=1 Tax=Galendromus occidentalis TaxID=34638 RepID=A0AAJ7L7E2_9ACAR|nr:erythroferrone-like [Galendromus occidentalis]